MKCKICNNETEKEFSAELLRKYKGDFFYCKNCGFLFSGDPYWLPDAYRNPINVSDTGIMERNLRFSEIVSVLIYFLFDSDGRFVDYAGGYGIFTRLMRDIGFDFYWQDPFCTNLLARGFEYREEKMNGAELVTAFEVFEHLTDPLQEIEKMKDLSANIIFSTVLLPQTVPQPQEWWYYGFEHGQHISFYSNKTILKISEIFKLNLYSLKDVFILSEKKLNPVLIKLLEPLSPLLFHYVKMKMNPRTGRDFEEIKKAEL